MLPESALETKTKEEVFGTQEFDSEINALVAAPEVTVVEQIKPEADPAKKNEADPAQGEKKSDETGAGGAEADGVKKDEGKKEGEAEGKAGEAGAPPAPVFPIESFREVFPEAMTAEDVVNQSKRLREMLETEQKATTELRELLDETPALKKILQSMASGAPIHTALQEAMEEAGTPPDPSDDPKKYAEFVRKQVQYEQSKKQQEADQRKAQEKLEQIKKFGVAERDRFRKDVPMSDEEFKTFADWARSIVEGDAKTGQPPANFLHSLYRAYRYQDDITRTRLEAKKEGANEALRNVIDQTKKKNAGDGLPHPKGGQQPLPEKEDDILADIDRSVTTNAIFS